MLFRSEVAMTKIQQKIHQLGEAALRKLLKQAYHAPSLNQARIVIDDGSIQNIGANDREGYSISIEHANNIIQTCQSRLHTIYDNRKTLSKQLMIHGLLASLAQQQQHQHALKRIVHQ